MAADDCVFYPFVHIKYTRIALVLGLFHLELLRPLVLSVHNAKQPSPFSQEPTVAGEKYFRSGRQRQGT